MPKIDLRSDTVTLPSPEMRDAMYKAELGDDVFGDDPTVNRLQDLAAERMGKEAGLFVASGTMGNLVSLLTHCRRGDEVILGNRTHIYNYEQGGMAAMGGMHARSLPHLPDGRLDLQLVEGAINSDDEHLARTRLICLENSWCKGRVLKPDYTAQVSDIARRHGLSMHLDGARIFNAAIALGVPAKQLVKHFDSVQFCFSKGLSAPVGSMIVGSKEFIKEARRNRKIVGGGMRQVGVLAAACIVALDSMIERLAEDHENAAYLAKGLAEIAEVDIDPTEVETNLVFFGLKSMSVDQFAQRLSEEGILLLAAGSGTLRAVTHYGIERSDIDQVLQACKRVLSTAATGKAQR